MNYLLITTIFMSIVLFIERGDYFYLFLAFFSVYFLWRRNKSKKKKKADETREFENRLKEHKFRISRELPAGTRKFLLDNANQKFAIWDKPTLKVYKFKDLQDFDYYEDGHVVRHGGGGTALVGGLAYGFPGMMIGAAVGSKTDAACSSMGVEIYLDNINEFSIRIPTLTSRVYKNSDYYRQAKNETSDILAALAYIERQNNRDL